MLLEQEIAGYKNQAKLLLEKIQVIAEAKILETNPSILLRYTKDIEKLEKALENVRRKLADLSINLTESQALKQNITPRFGVHHQYTCNRDEQDKLFFEYITNKDNAAKKLHFFYLYGSRKQEHKGLFRRFCNTLAGRNRKNTINKEEEKISVVKFENINYPKDTSEDTIQKRIAYEMIERFDIQEPNPEDIASRNLAYIIKNSPELQGLTEEDKVCCFIRIPSRRWDAALTPKTTIWFIEHFCSAELPVVMPEFFFFFSVAYKEEDQTTKEELLEFIKPPIPTSLLPELAMVEKGDVEDWFDDYKEFWEDDRDQEGLLKQHFGDKAEKMYMAEVQDILKTIIDDINYPEKDVPRNS